jgi:catechol 2,3-dioxygenase-like lactoylglutathione lyase family enzyme
VDFGGVFGVKLPVSDLARSRHWYEQVFGFTVALEFPDHEGVVRGVAGSLPGLGDISISLRENRPVAAALAGYDILHLSVASRDELEDWAAKLDRLTVEHSPIRGATSHWLMSVVEPDRLEVRLHSRESHSLDDAAPRPDRGRRVADQR